MTSTSSSPFFVCVFQDSLLQHLPGARNTGAAPDPAAGVLHWCDGGVGGHAQGALGLDPAGHPRHCIQVSWSGHVLRFGTFFQVLLMVVKNILSVSRVGYKFE